MNDQLVSYLPSTHQKLAVMILAVLGSLWIIRMVRYHRFREEHALLWFLGLAAVTLVIWVDPLLYGVTRAMGIEIPASAMILLVIFFLSIMAIWLTSVVSRQEEEIAQLVMAVSIVKAKLAEAPERGSAD